MNGLLGHEHVKAGLHTALIKNQVAHAQLFIGPEGVGKFKMAQALAQTLLCENSHVDFCGQCPSCIQVQNGQHQGLKIINSENAQIKMEDARGVLRDLTLRNWNGARIVIINDAHKLNSQASNALLKVIEEPPEQTYFLLVSSQPGKILSTIRSRTQVMRFGPLKNEELQKITGASGWVVSSANGSVTRVEQLLSGEVDEIRSLALRSLVGLLSGQQTYLQWMEGLQSILKDKTQVVILLETWLQMLRDLRVEEFSTPYHFDLMVELKQVPLIDLSRLDLVFQIVNRMKHELEYNVDRSLLLESGFLKVQQVLSPEQDQVVL